MTSNIRPYADEDLDTIMLIEQASFPNAWSRETFVGWMQRPGTDCRVLEQEGRVVGFLVAVYGPAELHIANLAIDPDFRRRGLAFNALERVDEMAATRGVERIVLEVRETNLAAQLLYRKAGYRAVRIASDYYRSEDAYQMTKRLAPGARPVGNAGAKVIDIELGET